jgi:hypothetical protein
MVVVVLFIHDYYLEMKEGTWFMRGVMRWKLWWNLSMIVHDCYLEMKT